MSIIRVQVSVPQDVSGVGADFHVNTWHFANIGSSTPAESAADAHGWLTTFYQAIDAQLASAAIGDTMTLKAYDLEDNEPRTTIYENTIGLVAQSGDPLPPEIALCLSFRAAFTSGIPKARRRGRVFLGPFLETANVSPGRPSTTLTDVIRDAAAALLTSSEASTDTVWVVHSPTLGVSSPAMVPPAPNVVGGWVDDAWDVQRRRGFDLTTRDEFGQGRT